MIVKHNFGTLSNTFLYYRPNGESWFRSDDLKDHQSTLADTQRTIEPSPTGGPYETWSSGNFNMAEGNQVDCAEAPILPRGPWVSTDGAAPVTRAEFDALKREVEALHIVIKALRDGLIDADLEIDR